MALALLMQGWCKERGARLLALTVDHGLRPESARECENVHKILTARGIEHKILSWTGEKPKTHVQEEARHARYRLLQEECRRNNFTSLVVAHNLEDQIETFWMRLAHGSGLDGLAGMSSVRKIGDITIIRPLLDFPRERLRATCKDRGVEWLEDPSNKNGQFLRVRLRQFEDALAAEGMSPQRLAQTMKKLATASEALDFATCHLMAGCLTFYPEGYAVIRLSCWQKFPAEIQRRILAHALQAIAPQPYPIGFDQMEQLREHCNTPPFDGKTLGGCEILQARDDELLLCRELGAIEPRVPLQEGMVWDKRFIVTGCESLRDIEIGTLGEAGLAALRKDLSEESAASKQLEALPAKVRKTLPAVWKDSRTISVPHLHWNAAEHADALKQLKLHPAPQD